MIAVDFNAIYNEHNLHGNTQFLYFQWWLCNMMKRKDKIWSFWVFPLLVAKRPSSAMPSIQIFSFDRFFF